MNDFSNDRNTSNNQSAKEWIDQKKSKEGTLFQGDSSLNRAFYKFIDFYNGNNRYGLPRNGIYSITSRRTPSFIYNHPALLAICDTAFTDGTRVFWSSNFFQKLIESRVQNQETYHDLEFIQTHELRHVMNRHLSRLTDINQDVANIATDEFINIDIQKTFPEWNLSRYLRTSFLGFTDKEKELFSDRSEEGIARILKDLMKEKEQENKNKTNSSQNHESTEQPSETCPGTTNKRNNSNSTLNEVLKDLTGGSSSEKDFDHDITVEELINALSSSGDDELLQKMGIDPDATNQQKQQQVKSELAKLQHDLAEANQHRKNNPNGKLMPGGHVEDCISQNIKDLTRPKLSFKLAVRNLLAGEGMNDILSDEIPDDIYHVEPDVMGFDSELYMEGTMFAEPDYGSYLFIVDTSGSVDNRMLNTLFAEVFAVYQDDDMTNTTMYLASADTNFRGEIQIIDQDNYNEAITNIKAHGRGGTNFTTSINASIAAVKNLDPEITIRGIIYATDLEANTPRREDLPEDLPQIAFIADEASYKAWSKLHASKMDGWGTVHQITEGEIIDFENSLETLTP